MAEFYLIRSDEGDGGWSLHIAGSDPDGCDEPILSGEAEWDETLNAGYGDWNRPNAADYAAAAAEYARLPANAAA